MALDTNLVAHYLLNNNADDSFGTYDGTVNGVIDLQGDVAYFNKGIGTQITIPSILGIETVSLWCSFDNTTATDYKTIISMNDTGGTYTSMVNWGAGVAWRFYVSDLIWIDFVIDSSTLTIDRMYHVLVTKVGGIYYGYLDGVLVGQVASTALINIKGFGHHIVEERNHKGNISNVRFYSDNKDQAFITDLFEEGYYPKPLPLPTTTNLIAHYPLTGTAEDTTGTYDGTENNIYNNDAEFGSVAYVSTTTSRVRTFVDNYNVDKTITIWHYQSSTSGEIILDNGSTGTAYPTILLRSDLFSTYSVNAGGATLRLQLNYSIPSVGWHFYEVIFDGLDITVNMDGVQQGTGTKSGSVGNSTYVTNIFTNISDTAGVVGQKARGFRTYDDVLTTQELTDIYNYEKNFRHIDIDDGLIAYYPLANNSLDNYHNEYDGTDTSITYDGDSATFNGTTSYLTSAPIFLNSSFTIGFWFNANTIDTTGRVILANGWELPAERRFGFYLDTDLGTFSINMGTDATWRSIKIINENTLYGITLTYDGTTTRVYVNKVEELSFTTTFTPASSKFCLGDFYDGQGTTTFDGNISKVRIYNKAITSEQVEVIYNTENLVEASPLATASLAVTATALATPITSNIPVATASIVVTATAKAIPYIPIATASLVVTASASHTEIASANASVSLTASAVVTFYPRGLATLSVTATASPLQHVPNATATLTVTASAHNVVYEAIVTANVSVTSQANVIASIPTTTTFTFVQSIQLTEVQSSFKFVQSIEQPTTNTIIQRVNI